jgi:hypothetical protein
VSVEQYVIEANEFFDRFEAATPCACEPHERTLAIGALAACTEQGQAILRVAVERGVRIELVT